jgi:CO/xanthine dehydrogenase Mo-binding subunit
VYAVFTAEDLGDYWQHGPLLVSPPPIERCVFNERTQVPLAKDKVHYVGEPVVLIVAESRYVAEDAIAEVDIDYEALPVAVDTERHSGKGRLREGARACRCRDQPAAALRPGNRGGDGKPRRCCGLGRP